MVTALHPLGEGRASVAAVAILDDAIGRVEPGIISVQPGIATAYSVGTEANDCPNVSSVSLIIVNDTSDAELSRDQR